MRHSLMEYKRMMVQQASHWNQCMNPQARKSKTIEYLKQEINRV